MKQLFFSLFIIFSYKSIAQSSACNNVGVWLWRLEYTNVKTHAHLADSLQKLGVNRIYVKVLDGRAYDKWTQYKDKALVKAYNDKGIKVWAWTYNYPNNEAAQAVVVADVAKTGYEGLVVDVEIEFDNDSLALYKLFNEFGKARQSAINQGFITPKFELRCTTWGNPKTHKFNIKAINPFVQAFMPQTYVEQWGKSYITNLEKWIDNGNKEFKNLGATKPIHHIVATEYSPSDTTKTVITASQINRFLAKAGEETSIWAVPQKASNAIWWKTWSSVNWKYDFKCQIIADDEQPLAISNMLDARIYPNPFSDNLNLKIEDEDSGELLLSLTNLQGQILKTIIIYPNSNNEINTTDLPQGLYIATAKNKEYTKSWKLIKI